MIDFTTDINEDLEKTQGLPMLTGDTHLDAALLRERAARIEIVELMRQNIHQAKEIEQLRRRQLAVVTPAHRITQSTESHSTTEERLFEVCGALKNALSKVLTECRTKSLALSCGSVANRMLEDAGYQLEEILSAPGFSAPTAFHAKTAPTVPNVEASRSAVLTFRRQTRLLD